MRKSSNEKPALLFCGTTSKQATLIKDLASFESPRLLHIALKTIWTACLKVQPATTHKIKGLEIIQLKEVEAGAKSHFASEAKKAKIDQASASFDRDYGKFLTILQSLIREEAQKFKPLAKSRTAETGKKSVVNL